MCYLAGSWFPHDRHNPVRMVLVPEAVTWLKQHMKLVVGMEPL